MWHTAVFYRTKTKVLFLLCRYQFAGKENSFYLGFFDVLLTVQLSIILVINQLNAQILVL